MKQLIFCSSLALAVTCATSVSAQDLLSNFSQSDLQQLQQIACTESSSDAELTNALGQIEPLLNQALAAYGIDMTEDLLQSASDEASQMLAQLETDNSVKQFCSGF